MTAPATSPLTAAICSGSALESLRVRETFDYDDLDEATRASIEEAEAQCDRGEGIPVEQALAELKRKHFGK